MSFYNLSQDLINNEYTSIENTFFQEYLVDADDIQLKVYLYGFFLCKNPNAEDITPHTFATNLSLSQEEVIRAYEYWQELGLIKIVTKHPLEVRYKALKTLSKVKKFKPKYADFNDMLQSLFPTRMMLPNEFNDYYEVIENYRIDIDAMIMIVSHCVKLKGVGIRTPYILKVARDWASEGVTNILAVEDRISKYNQTTDSIREIMKALGKISIVDLEEQQLFDKWTRNWGYTIDAIKMSASLMKRKGGFNKLDIKLDEYYRMNIFDSKDIEEYNKIKDNYYTLAYAINRELGVFYESVDSIIETYIKPWLDMGFEEKALIKLAHYCLLSGKKTLVQLQDIVLKFRERGRITVASIEQYLTILVANDYKIAKIIEATASDRVVTSKDRQNYQLWSLTWNLCDEIILYGASLSAGRLHAMSYLNQILSKWHTAGITKVTDAKKFGQKTILAPNPAKIDNTNYDNKEIKALFDDINNFDDIEV